ncbi:hypothetical protein ACI3E1_07105 [Ligilactobacillus sp. LYQ139]|uniref:hypothetical protein n=1 Tax=Ligilactobacillus sp. LYQ139 TaxID=3378800 RepID=UPI0038524E0B
MNKEELMQAATVSFIKAQSRHGLSQRAVIFATGNIAAFNAGIISARRNYPVIEARMEKFVASLLEEFGVKKTVPVKIRRSKSYYGLTRAKIINRKRAADIEINEDLLVASWINAKLNHNPHAWDLMKDTLIHEAGHVGLFLTRQPSDDKSTEHKNWLRKWGLNDNANCLKNPAQMSAIIDGYSYCDHSIAPFSIYRNHTIEKRRKFQRAERPCVFVVVGGNNLPHADEYSFCARNMAIASWRVLYDWCSNLTGTSHLYESHITVKPQMNTLVAPAAKEAPIHAAEQLSLF